jgi:hypothetical protein
MGSLNFDIDLADGAEPGKYPVCYCDASSSSRLEVPDAYFPHYDMLCRSEISGQPGGVNQTTVTPILGTVTNIDYNISVMSLVDVTKELNFSISVEYMDYDNTTLPRPLTYARRAESADVEEFENEVPRRLNASVAPNETHMDSGNGTDINVNVTTTSAPTPAPTPEPTTPYPTPAPTPGATRKTPLYVEREALDYFSYNISFMKVDINISAKFVYNNDTKQFLNDLVPGVVATPPQEIRDLNLSIAHADIFRVSVPVFAEERTIPLLGGAFLTVGLVNCSTQARRPLVAETMSNLFPYCDNRTNVTYIPGNGTNGSNGTWKVEYLYQLPGTYFVPDGGNGSYVNVSACNPNPYGFPEKFKELNFFGTSQDHYGILFQSAGESPFHIHRTQAHLADYKNFDFDEKGWYGKPSWQNDTCEGRLDKAYAYVTTYGIGEVDNVYRTDYVNYTNYTEITGHYVSRDVIQASSSFASHLCTDKCGTPAAIALMHSSWWNATCSGFDAVVMGTYDTLYPLFLDEGTERLGRTRVDEMATLYGDALCLNRTACAEACSELDVCNGFDAHANGDVCYLTTSQVHDIMNNGTLERTVPACEYPASLVPAPRSHSRRLHADHDGWPIGSAPVFEEEEAAGSEALWTSFERDRSDYGIARRRALSTRNVGSPSDTIDNTYQAQSSRRAATTLDMETIDTRVAASRRRYNMVKPEILGWPLEFHLCKSKCGGKHPCYGPHCYCDGFSADELEHALCLPLDLCFAACEQVATCTGVSSHIQGVNRCLLTDESALLRDDQYDFFQRERGPACRTAGDFATIESTVTLTSRVHLRRGDVVIGSGPRRPDCRDDLEYDDLSDLPFSVEVSGQGLDWNKDRMLLLDCGKTCGDPDVTPTDAVVKPHYSTVPNSVATFNVFHAYTSFIDRPADDFERVDYAPYGINAYGVLDEVFCPSMNFDSSSLGFHSRHLCYKKCVLEGPCVGDHCHCDGLNEAVDGRESDALCLPPDECQRVCDQMTGCSGIDMHRNRPRCYINKGGWEDRPDCLPLQVAGDGECGKGGSEPLPALATGWGRCDYGVVHDRLGHDPEYTLVFKLTQEVKNAFRDMRNPPAFRYVERRLEERRLVTSDADMSCLNVKEGDKGYSWDKLLRFTPVQLNQGGRYRLCFCDHTLSASGKCEEASDYSLDVGYVQSSGLSCFLNDDMFIRDKFCVPMYHGGQRCFDSEEDWPDRDAVPEDQELRFVMKEAPEK